MTDGLLIGVLGSLIAAFVVFAFTNAFSRLRAAILEYQTGRGFHRRMVRAGFTNFYESRDDFAKYRGAPSLVQYLDNAQKSIHIVAHWMSHGIEMEGIADHIASLVRPPKALSVTIAMIDPTSSALADAAQYWNVASDELKMRLQSSLSKLDEARQKLSAQERHRYSLKVYRTLPTASVIMLDAHSPNGRIQIDIKPYKAARQRSFAFELRGSGKYLYDLCRSAWCDLLDDSEEFDPARHLR